MGAYPPNDNSRVNDERKQSANKAQRSEQFALRVHSAVLKDVIKKSVYALKNATFTTVNT